MIKKTRDANIKRILFIFFTHPNLNTHTHATKKYHLKIFLNERMKMKKIYLITHVPLSFSLYLSLHIYLYTRTRKTTIKNHKKL